MIIVVGTAIRANIRVIRVITATSAIKAIRFVGL